MCIRDSTHGHKIFMFVMLMVAQQRACNRMKMRFTHGVIIVNCQAMSIVSVRTDKTDSSLLRGLDEIAYSGLDIVVSAA